MPESREIQLVVLKPLLVDLGEGRLETLQPGHVLEQHEVTHWGRSVDALIDAGKLARIPKPVESPVQFTDTELLQELEARGLDQPAVPDGVAIPEGARVFTAADAEELVEDGTVMVKQPSPVHLVQQDEAFAVETDSGTMLGEPGWYVAHDPISGHVWPISAEYVEQHYAEPSIDGEPDENVAEV